MGRLAVTGNGGEDERLYFVNGSGELLVGVRQSSGAMKYEDVIKPGGGSTIPGIDFAGQNFFDIASVGEKDVNVAGGGGIVYRYDGFRWTPHVIDGGRQAIRAIDRDGDDGLAAGVGGKMYERLSAGQWQRQQTSVETTFRGASHGSNGVDVAVGDGGTIVERVTDEGSGGTTTTTTTTTTETNTTTTTETSTNTTTTAATLVSIPDTSKTVKQYLEGEWV
ncbi:hypothetical protein [Haladaptatus litoreus]|uniref:hypothetical protein n=1 Tax=Haladaptatus litoreus TaxID=553468 RepID=UPI001FE910B8|nr:hypothetical protein [Haladaptatus litoreus]